MSKKGIVYLVGAGPGDPGLITLKAIECLKKAEVVVYDHLVNPELLSYVPKDAEIIYAGKVQNRHTLTQDEINRLLVKKASAGKCVVRVKGGDPFIFGRGGEEAESLLRAKIPFEIVPGITSAIAVPAYAGIPITMRRMTSTAGFITGHEDPAKEISDIPWDKVSTGMGTLVFLMGLSNLSAIVKQLITHGRNPDTPAAVIQWGTLPSQKTVTGALKDIAEKVRRAGLKPPSIIVVGEVVKLRSHLNWFEKRPLFGKRILVTRAREQASELSSLLKGLGAEVIEFPTIDVRPLSNYNSVDKTISNLSEYSYAFFTSANGVRFFRERLNRAGLDSRQFANVKICAIGPRTAEELEKMGIKPDLVPSEYQAEGILNKLGAKNLKGRKVLILRAEEARTTLPDGLRKLGAKVDVIPVYRTVKPKAGSKTLQKMFKEKKIHIVTFTSSSTVRNFVALFPRAGLRNFLKGVTIASIGPITSKTARGYGLKVHIEARKFTIPGLVSSILKSRR